MSTTAGSQPEPFKDTALIGLVTAIMFIGALWVAGIASAHIAGHNTPHGHSLGEVTAFAHFGNPSAAWHEPVGPAGLYWTVSLLTVSLLVVVLYCAWRVFHPGARSSSDDPTLIEGLASRKEVRAAAGAKALLARAATLRPSVKRPTAADVGWRLGQSRGVGCWMGVRDSMMLLGPPGAGKGYHLVIQHILDAPGAVITTSTRPDNLAAAMTARAKVGPVGVFDPEGLATGVPSALRWSPVRGCERAQTAMIRAAGLTAKSAKGVTDANFWEDQTRSAVCCLLHAAAVGGRGASSLYEWSLSAPAAREAVQLLVRSPGAIPLWDRRLDSIISADPKQRDSVWAMVGNAFGTLADPKVLTAVSPSPEETFNPAEFLRQKGTLFLVGTASGASATASLVAALIEDVVQVARRLAAASPGARLDPPLGLILDEAANYPLPSLGALMSEGGGTGISTMVVLQSLAQARDKWGREQADAIWDASTVKVILGGSSNADDLGDLSRMIGDRTVRERSQSWQAGGGRSVSESERERAILDPAMIRTLPFGYGLLLLRSAKPIMLTLRPWTNRHDAAAVKAGQVAVEQTIRDAAAAEWGSDA
jgi:type IV secretion system protein VirD4